VQSPEYKKSINKPVAVQVNKHAKKMNTPNLPSNEVQSKKSKKKQHCNKQVVPASVKENSANCNQAKPKVDSNSIAQASIEDIVKDSLKEREKTLNAANVLLGFMNTM